MALIGNYHRPSNLGEALTLLDRPGIVTRPLGGGTQLNDRSQEQPDEVVDLQGLGLGAIDHTGAAITLGAMVTLQELADHAAAPPALRELTRRSAPSTIRNMATVGGTIAAGDWENPFLAGLLAYGASVSVAGREGTGVHLLVQLLADRRLLEAAIITEATFDASGTAAWAATGRTPADTPIVLVAGRRDDNGDVTMAATGLAPSPILLDPGRLDQLDPPADFRGSSEYRRHLAAVLSGRVRARLEGQQ